MIVVCFDVSHITVVVFDIAGSKLAVRIQAAFKFGENFFVAFPEDMGLNIDATAVSHPHDNLPASLHGCKTNKIIKHGDDRLGPFKGEAGLT